MTKRIFLFFTLFAFVMVIACQPKPSNHNNSSSSTASAPPAAPDGKKIFRTNCVTCHGIDGSMGLNGAKPIGESVLTVEERVLLITNGKNTMTPYKGILEPDQIKAVAEYTMTLGK